MDQVHNLPVVKKKSGTPTFGKKISSKVNTSFESHDSAFSDDGGGALSLFDNLVNEKRKQHQEEDGEGNCWYFC